MTMKDTVSFGQLLISIGAIFVTIILTFLIWIGKTSDKIAENRAKIEVLQSQSNSATVWRDETSTKLDKISDIVIDIRIQLQNKKDK